VELGATIFDRSLWISCRAGADRYSAVTQRMHRKRLKESESAATPGSSWFERLDCGNESSANVVILASLEGLLAMKKEESETNRRMV